MEEAIVELEHILDKTEKRPPQSNQSHKKKKFQNISDRLC